MHAYRSALLFDDNKQKIKVKNKRRKRIFILNFPQYSTVYVWLCLMYQQYNIISCIYFVENNNLPFFLLKNEKKIKILFLCMKLSCFPLNLNLKIIINYKMADRKAEVSFIYYIFMCIRSNIPSTRNCSKSRKIISLNKCIQN